MTWINAVTTYGTFSKIPQSNLSDKIVATSFSGRSREYPREPPTMGKSTGKLYHLRLRVECTFL